MPSDIRVDSAKKEDHHVYKQAWKLCMLDKDAKLVMSTRKGFSTAACTFY